MSPEYQNNAWQWPVRTDVPVSGGESHIDTYSNTSPMGFRNFMDDRAGVERWRGIFERVIGPVEGVDPNTLDM
jgi:hypothetical protein